jgi:muramoyltetrapeptide carboxypeptidase
LASRKPKTLRDGGTIAVVAPSSPAGSRPEIDKALQFLSILGFKVRAGENLYQRTGFLAGSDKERAHDLATALSDDSVDAIFMLRGGYGSQRLLPLLELSKYRKVDKIILGFSDITAILGTFFKSLRLITFHGPTVISLAKGENEFALRSLLQAVTGEDESYSLLQYYEGRDQQVEILRAGVVKGTLVGGNLSILGALCGTKYQLNAQGRIMFFEEVNEAPYCIDRLLTQLIQAGVFDGVIGFALGQFTRCEAPLQKGSENVAVKQVIYERLEQFKVPILYGLPLGHIEENGTVPIGGEVVIEGRDRGDLTILRPTK